MPCKSFTHAAVALFTALGILATASVAKAGPERVVSPTAATRANAGADVTGGATWMRPGRIWTGVGVQPGSGEWSIEIEFNANGHARIDYRTLGCGGILEPQNIGQTAGVFREKITRRSERCTNDGAVTLTPIDIQNIQYSYIKNKSTAHGFLLLQNDSTDQTDQASSISRSIEIYNIGCESGDEWSCFNLGSIYYFDFSNDPGRSAEAISLFGSACEGGVGAACRTLASKYYSGEGVTKDMARAAALYEQACDGGDLGGCNWLGGLYFEGKGVPKDLARATKHYQQACDAGNAWGCNAAGNRYYLGEGVAKDHVRAAELYRQACDGGELWGCNTLGNIYYSGQGVAKLPAHAAVLYRQACEGGLAQSCNSVGILHERGDGVAKDLARAAELYRQACDGGIEEACSARQRAATGAAREEQRRALEATREAQNRALAERKEQLRQELVARVDAWLSRSGVIENVADALDVDRQRTLVQLAAGHRMRIKVSSANFENGRFVIQQRFGATDLDDAAGDSAFSWDRWFAMTQNPSRGIWTVYCLLTPDQAGDLQEGESIVVEAKLVATNQNFGNNMVVECAR